MDNKNINTDEVYAFKDHLISNNPIADDAEYGDYADILDTKIKDKKIKNIGIIAPYGAGKSSLIETYKQKIAVQKGKSKILTISLANFNSDKIKKDPNGTKGNCVGDIDCELEKSILQQILFKAKNKELPESQIKRIEGNKKVRPFWTSLLIIASILGIVLTVLEFLGELPKSNGSLFYIFLIPTVLLSFVSTFILIRNKTISKINFKDLEVYMDPCNNDTTLNIFLDEILYFFKKKKIEIVIIEDLDRFENTNVFSKLRELNFLINNSDNVNQKVTFVYSVKDDLFETDADRAKFFDYIISLIPVMSFTNARDKLKNIMKEHFSKNMYLSDLYIQEISHFVVEMRILKNIVNDYIMYYHLLNLSEYGHEQRNIKLFSLMLYKNIHPKDYAMLQYGNGVLAKVFDNLRTNAKEKINKLRDEIKAKEADIELANNNTIKSFEQLKWIVKAIILKNRNYNSSVQAINIATLSSFDGAKYIQYQASGYCTYNISVEQLEKELGFSVLEEEKKIKNRTEESIAKINEEIKEKREQIGLLSNCTVKEYIRLDDSIIKDCDLLTKMLLANGYIAEDYRDYMSKNGQEIITSNDNDFIKNVIAKQKTEFSVKLEKPQCVIQELKPHHFSDIYVLNYDIVMSLLSKADCEKKTNLVNLLSSNQKETNEFIIGYINDGNDINLILDNLTPCFNGLYELILDSKVDEWFAIVEYLICNYDIKSIKKQNQNDCISKCLSEMELCINKFKIEYLQKLLNVIVACDACLKDITCVPDRYHVAESIVELSRFEINSNNLSFFLEKIKGKETGIVENALYSSILETKYEKLITYVENNIEKLLDIILKKETHSEKQDAVERVLNCSIEQSIKDEFIEKSAVRYNLFETISNECAKKSFEELKISPKWSNILMAINSKKTDIKNAITYLEEFSVEFGCDTLNDVSLFILICKQKYNRIETFSNLMEAFKGTISVDLNIPDENLAILIEKEKIILNDTSFKVLAKKPISIEQCIYQDSGYANKLSLIGFDSNVCAQLLKSSKLNNAIKSKILNAWKTNYLPSDEREVRVMADVILKWDSVTDIPINSIHHCLKNTSLAKGTKETIITTCCKDLDNKYIIPFVQYVDSVYADIMSKKKIKVDGDEVNPEIMRLLKTKSIINYHYRSKRYYIK